MNLLSLTTDYGNTEYYAAVLKARLYGAIPALNIVDINHTIPQHDLGFAAYQLRAALFAFPENSIHLCCVNEFLYPRHGLVIIKESGQWFVLPNNGLLYLLFEYFESTPLLMSAPDDIQGRQQRIVDIILSITSFPDELEGDDSLSLIEKLPLKPILSKGVIRAKIMHIDHYGNLILNITKKLFEEHVKSSSFVIEFRKYKYTAGLLDTFCDVEIGEIGCCLSPSGYLVISAFQDKADELLDVRIDEIVNLWYK